MTASDMTHPNGNDHMPIPIRLARRDMVKNIMTDPRMGLLNLETWEMARSLDEKRELCAGAQREMMILAWSGDRWTDFFHFDDDHVWAALLSALMPRRSAMLTDDEYQALQQWRAGELVPMTQKKSPVKKRPAARRTV